MGDMDKKICLFGLGYIGLPTALLFAKAGYDVVGYDVDKAKIEKLNNGELPFVESGMDQLFEDARSNFKAIAEPERSDIFIVAVPTPVTDDNQCDLSYVLSAIKTIKKLLSKDNIVIIESTVNPRATADIVRKELEESGLVCNKDFSLVFVSEKAIPGKTISEMINNVRIIGGVDEKGASSAKELYSSFVKGDIIITDSTTAEVAKLMENTFRDVNIALANEFALMSKKFKVDVWEAIGLANKHPRVNIHSPGPGVGGHCIPIDPWFLSENNRCTGLIEHSRKINDSMPEHVVDIVKENIDKGSSIAVLGLSYKGNVDDIRKSPSIDIIRLLKEQGYKVRINDPFVVKYDEKIYDLDEAINRADCVLVLVDHDIYKSLSADDLAKAKGKVIIDTRNIINKENFKDPDIKIITLGNYK